MRLVSLNVLTGASQQLAEGFTLTEDQSNWGYSVLPLFAQQFGEDLPRYKNVNEFLSH